MLYEGDELNIVVLVTFLVCGAMRRHLILNDGDDLDIVVVHFLVISVQSGQQWTDPVGVDVIRRPTLQNGNDDVVEERVEGVQRWQLNDRRPPEKSQGCQ